ncbi:MAG TPA: tetratricopeptide repeat protein [Planctomycetaceae bacterium]|nr:tetratricopeptide repeat protein [Planctomycetaceae bacterium]
MSDRQSQDSGGHSPPYGGSPPLAGERVAFTGTLASMPHRLAHELVEQNGGIATEHVSRHTTMLVVGEEGWPLDADGETSQKLRQVTSWNQERAEGHRTSDAGHTRVESAEPIHILTESQWLHLVGLDERRDEMHRLYTPAMLSRMLDVPVRTIRRWERLGLIRPARKVHKLPYFDFQEAAGVRRLSQLLDDGVPARRLEATLVGLQALLGVERPLAQLEILSRDSRVVYRDRAGVVEATSGQRLLEFDASPAGTDRNAEPIRETLDEERAVQPGTAPEQHCEDPPSTIPLRAVRLPGHETGPTLSADQWFAEGCFRLERDDVGGSIAAFRQSLMRKPGEAEFHFHLADALYRAGQVDAALERYYAATEADPEYLEAWTQLGCLCLERGDPHTALWAFETALVVHAEYPDAHLHAAEALRQLGRESEAIVHWKAYLRFDSRGPWADETRERLEAAGVEVAGIVGDGGGVEDRG